MNTDKEKRRRKRNEQKLRYLMPAEWEAHEATWLAWPKDPFTFPPGIVERVERSYVEIIRSLSRGEKVHVLVDDVETHRRASSLVQGNRNNVVYHETKTTDVWVRDYGPIFVRDELNGGRIIATKWRFNAWGDKYQELEADDKTGLEIAKATGLEVVEPRFVLEGGSIDTNGRGTCITTEQCLLNKNRNPCYGRDEIEGVLERYLGFTNIVWLGQGIVGDDTDGHVDDLARFVSDRTVICMVEDDRSDDNCASLKENFERLKLARDQEGRRLMVVPISMPRKRVGGDDDDKERLPASYANFYVANSVVLVPTFDDPNDAAALRTISAAFPTREVKGINCEALVYGFGAIHCVTQQQPGDGRSISSSNATAQKIEKHAREQSEEESLP